ncbi:MAG: hypothetical protein JJU36_06745 [Phycisphaeraceae bacterium]|nr:hypothetical protein [Phycisphaeraceae bacterium]
MNQTANTEHRADCEQLLEVATPHIYRRNLFRVLNIPVNATSKDVQRQQTRRKMQEKLGIVSVAQHNGPLTLDPPPSEEDIRAAMERLNSPIDRLLDEVFWFWPTNGDVAGDDALKALEEGNVKRAAEIWMGLAKVAGDGHIATHNLAVLDHMVALDYEAKLTSSGLSKKEQQQLEDLWVRGFARWKEVVDGEDFWSVVKTRVRELNDTQLTTGFVRRARGTLPTALLLISAKIAYAAAERSDIATAQRHSKLLRDVNFGDGLADEAIREAIRPIRNRIKTAVDKAKSRWTSKPHQGNRHVRELYEQSKAMLAVVDAILTTEDLTRGGMHDTVAEAMLEGQIAFGNKTNDWQECIQLIELAQKLAHGGTVQSRLSENKEILKTNAESGNDWCAPGYWDQPDAVVAVLESARDLANAGNFDRAIGALVVLDPKIGKPLRRALAYCLSLHSIRVHNEAMSDLNVESGVIKEIMGRLRGGGEAGVMLLLARRPDPNSPAFLNPPCLCCGRTGYTSWVNFTYRDIPLFMCSTCSSRHDREREQMKSKLRGHMSTALEYLLLANEVDPGDAGIVRNLKVLKEAASEINCSTPKTKSLKERLGAQKVRGTRLTFEEGPQPEICHFCGEATGDKSCHITVPMCGDVRPVRLLFNDGIEYRYADVVVPRCHRCRDEHRELPGRIEAWHEARLAAADYEHFPKEANAVIAAKEAASEAAASVEKCKRSVAEAQTAVDRAGAIGGQCDRCNSDSQWVDGLCRQCDRHVYCLGTWQKIGVAAAGILLLIGVFVLQRDLGVLSPMVNLVTMMTGWSSGLATAVFGGTIPFLAVAGLTCTLKRSQWRRRRGLREQRQADIRQRRNTAMGEAQKRLDQATSALKTAEEAAKKPLAAHEHAQRRLREAREQGVQEFERTYPEPKLPTGVKPESAYVQFGQIHESLQRGWGFGHEVGDEGKAAANQPVKVAGLVAREPRPAKERIIVACPKCGKKQRIPKRDDVITVKCPCGQHFECRNGNPETLAEIMASNVYRWKDSGDPERWVKAQKGSWSHSDWQKLLATLKQSQYWPMGEDAIGHILESIKKRGKASGRDLILEIARQASDDGMVSCPVCNAKVKAKNLVQHYDKNHKGAAVPSTPSGGQNTAKSSKPVGSTAGSAGGASAKTATSDSKPKNAANRRTSGRTTLVDGNCPHCGKKGTFSRPDSTFWAECPLCKERVWVE